MTDTASTAVTSYRGMLLHHLVVERPQAASLSGGIAVAATAIRFEDPPLARFLFSAPRPAGRGLPLGLWLGWQWLEAGRHKPADPRWMETGAAIRAFWERAAPYQSRD